MNYFNRDKWWAIAFCILVALNIASLTAFWLVRERVPAGHHDPKSGAMDFLVKELGFDSLQKQKLILLREEHQQAMMENREKNREAKDALFTLLKQPDLADSVIQKAVDASSLYDRQIDSITFRHFQKIRNLCTPVQQIKFDSIIEEVIRMFGPPPGANPPGPPPPGKRESRPPREDDGRRPPPPTSQ